MNKCFFIFLVACFLFMPLFVTHADVIISDEIPIISDDISGPSGSGCVSSAPHFILAGALVAGTIVLIRAFWKPNKGGS